MSRQRIQQYHSEIDSLVRFSGSRNEHPKRLLEHYASSKNLILIAELEHRANGVVVRPGGTLKNAVCQDLGYWESKDERDDLDENIENKFARLPEKQHPL